jgi:hypothetical protein
MDWIHKELQRSPESKHPLIVHLRLYDDFTIDFLNNLNGCLECLKKELKEVKRYKTRLQIEYNSTFAEIEVASFCKRIGFGVSMQPILPSGKYSDFVLKSRNKIAYVEVTRKEKPKTEIIKTIGAIEISTLPIVKPETYATKIDDEIDQLSDDHPNILCIYLDPSLVPHSRNRQLAIYDGLIFGVDGQQPQQIVLGQSRFQLDKISAFFEFSNVYSNGYHLHKLMYLNQNSKYQIPDEMNLLFRHGRVEFAENPLSIPYSDNYNALDNDI